MKNNPRLKLLLLTLPLLVSSILSMRSSSFPSCLIVFRCSTAMFCSPRFFDSSRDVHVPFFSSSKSGTSNRRSLETDVRKTFRTALFSTKRRIVKPKDWELRNARTKAEEDQRLLGNSNKMMHGGTHALKRGVVVERNGDMLLVELLPDLVSNNIDMKDNIVNHNDDGFVAVPVIPTISTPSSSYIKNRNNVRVLCSQSPKLHNTRIVAGDFITVSIAIADMAAISSLTAKNKTATTRPVVIHVEDRKNLLLRPSGTSSKHKLELKAIASNIDHLLIVTCVAPYSSPVTIDRFIVAAIHHKIPAVSIVLNKMDMEGSDAMFEELRRYELIGYKVLRVSATAGTDMGELREALADRSNIFVGQSGVGKSSLINALLPGTEIEVGELVKNQALGAHTTSNARMHRIPAAMASIQDTRELSFERKKTGTEHDNEDADRGYSGVIIDSPGIRELGVWHLDRSSIEAGFVDIAHYAKGCRYRNCQHTAAEDREHSNGADIPLKKTKRYTVTEDSNSSEHDEEGDNSNSIIASTVASSNDLVQGQCAVRHAMRRGFIHPERLQSFHNLLSSC